MKDFAVTIFIKRKKNHKKYYITYYTTKAEIISNV
jgi:hypothetical protein